MRRSRRASTASASAVSVPFIAIVAASAGVAAIRADTAPPRPVPAGRRPGKAEAQIALIRGVFVEHRYRYRSNLVLHCPAPRQRGVRLVADGAVVHELKERAGRWREAKPRFAQIAAEQVALGLVERRQVQMVLRAIGKEVRKAVLEGSGGGESDELVDATELLGERCRSDAIRHFPARDMVGLAERRNDEAAREQVRIPRQTNVLAAVEDDVFIHFVGQQVDVAIRDDAAQGIDVRFVPYRAGGIVRRVENDQTRVRADRVAHPIPSPRGNRAPVWGCAGKNRRRG